jgi:hypothetical protein
VPAVCDEWWRLLPSGFLIVSRPRRFHLLWLVLVGPCAFVGSPVRVRSHAAVVAGASGCVACPSVCRSSLKIRETCITLPSISPLPRLSICTPLLLLMPAQIMKHLYQSAGPTGGGEPADDGFDDEL